jgi:hypothetical protein
MAYQLQLYGGYTGTAAGLIPVTINADSTTGGAVQILLTSLAAAYMAHPNTLNLDNYNIATGHDTLLVSGASAELAVFSNFSTAGVSAAGAVTTGLFQVPAAAAYLVVEAPGSYAVAGAAATRFALLGAAANVTYTLIGGTIPGASVLAGGGANTITIGLSGSVNITSTGDDTINLMGLGNDTLTANSGANDQVTILEGSATVIANGNALATVTFAEHAGGNLDFINNSTAPQTVFSGAYTAPGGASLFAPNAVTAFGGAGGGYFVGGLAGNNSLTGGTGRVTLQGGGAGDVLTATGGDSVVGNVFFSGNGPETLLATAGTVQNSFQIGGPYVGEGAVTTMGIASTNGTGAQYYFIGNVEAETITGSTQPGASNTYVVLGDSTAGGGSFIITDFGGNTGSLILLTGSTGANASDAAIAAIGDQLGYPGSSQIILTDGTTITLKNVAPSLLQTLNASNGIVGIYHM